MCIRDSLNVEFIMLYDFPRGFDERTLAELRNVLRNGSKCGIYTVISYPVSYTHLDVYKRQAYDNMEISGGRAVWKDVLAVYAVKTNTDKDNPQEVATMDESKKQILSDIFWEMNSISSRSESHSETEISETDDGNGNIVQTETTVTKTTPCAKRASPLSDLFIKPPKGIFIAILIIKGF